jgi:hypothetical protein
LFGRPVIKVSSESFKTSPYRERRSTRGPSHAGDRVGTLRLALAEGDVLAGNFVQRDKHVVGWHPSGRRDARVDVFQKCKPFNNQGLVKTEFRAGLALVRVAESSVTAIVYYQLGLFIAESEHILLVFIPSVVVGVPLGAYIIRRLDAETFRRICMSFDAWVVGFGLSRVLIELNLIESPWAYSVMVVTILIDLYLLYIFFTKRRQTPWATFDTPRPE